VIKQDEWNLCVLRAAVNWHEWKDCFEYKGHWKDIPVLSDPARFSKFTNEYGLRWIGNAAQRESFRQRLRTAKLLGLAVKNPTGSGLDVCAREVRAHDRRIQLSAISKIATFINPSDFIPIDSYAKSGLRELGIKGVAAMDYMSYREAVFKHAIPIMEKDINRAVKSIGKTYLPRNMDAFLLRVLDHVLMTIGGRWR